MDKIIKYSIFLYVTIYMIGPMFRPSEPKYVQKVIEPTPVITIQQQVTAIPEIIHTIATTPIIINTPYIEPTPVFHSGHFMRNLEVDVCKRDIKMLCELTKDPKLCYDELYSTIYPCNRLDGKDAKECRELFRILKNHCGVRKTW